MAETIGSATRNQGRSMTLLGFAKKPSLLVEAKRRPPSEAMTLNPQPNLSCYFRLAPPASGAKMSKRPSTKRNSLQTDFNDLP